jgi:hypothetical protein
MVLKIKVISGGQTGADQGGLVGAQRAGCITGGTAAPGFRTERGFEDVEDLKKFGLVEGEPDPKVYPKRTKRNVLDSDGTVLFGKSSPGYNQTLRYCKTNSKAYIENPTSDLLADWMTRNAINVLNVAGNRESVTRGIFYTANKTVYEALKILEERNSK